MQEASERDRIAFQYVTDYRDVFETGVPALRDAFVRGYDREQAAVHAYLSFLSRFPDSHVARKHGENTAAEVSRQAAEMNQALGRAGDPARELPGLEAFDRRLKARSINPGTSADMTVASLVAMDLEDSLAGCRREPDRSRRQRMSS
jgi:triphosphoribosyl-dephospho-CoA synthase